MIIALTGKAGAGKTTIANYLVEKHGFVKINFKDALVKEMRANFPDTLREMARFYHVTSMTWAAKFPDVNTPDDVLIDHLFNDKPPIMRALMQNYGTEVRRKDRSTYWVDQWITKVAGKQNVVVDDCRFLNEADAVRMQGGKVYKVEKIGYVDRLNHASETEQESIEIDGILKSKTGGHEFLYQQAEELLNERKKD
jgi:hypothetical protein